MGESRSKTAAAQEAAAQLERFERRNSAEGLMRRYATRRAQQFLSRQIPTALGGMALTFLVSPSVGALAVALALLGEGVDCLFLMQVHRLLAKGWPFPRVRRLVTLTACLQATTLVLCAALAWFGAPGGQTQFFTVAFMVGAVLNAGLVLPHCPQASASRIAIILTAVAGFFIAAWASGGPGDGTLLFNTLAAALLFYVSGVFLHYVSQGYFARTADKRATLLGKVQLAEAARALEEQSRHALRLAHVAEKANDSVIISDPEGRIEWVNETFTRITGYSAEDAIGRTPGELLNARSTDPETLSAIIRAAQEKKPIRTEIRNKRKDGTLIWMETSISPLLDGEGNVLMSIAIERDVTEAREHAEELARAKQAAEAANRAKSDFLAMMSHELRTPMNGIIGMADMLQRTDLSEEQAGYTQAIQTSGDALLEIISDILDYTQLEAGQVRITPAEFDLAACVAETCLLLQPAARQKGLALAWDVPPGAIHVTGDAGRIRQILVNLLSNAVKFTEAGCIAVALEALPDGYSRITVRDTGPGLSAGQLRRLFQPFQTASAPQRRTQGGVGLGLAICRTLAQAMGGALSATSEPGQGSTFSLDLPLPAAASDGPSLPPKPACPGNLPSGLQVLVAEDNRTNRLLIRKMLESGGLAPEFAENGREAIEKWRISRPDLILMDLSMPECTGIEATEAIRAEEAGGTQPATPIVALTANAFDSDRAACEAAGMNGFLTKPIKRDTLFTEIARHI
ncbi:PAS domain-containing hybrid sensor histidine kinase/response regulator [Pseudoruegeria sp. SHC-113]|uniref:PAS domain-containing hybrid sensor histidine kinase/response regulator n=1 Tax=Pseudoruegeria sp. SHC-113 TaxID=2855439 RepID=UPI0021BB599E|nr:PAS domain-containing hybrid sensor histidine kinase/response regulator [Pseudoruegeria sp. SHC-113]MCT8158815.1 response regulator [Pseudoruegeria sp. SHC-113]